MMVAVFLRIPWHFQVAKSLCGTGVEAPALVSVGHLYMLSLVEYLLAEFLGLSGEKYEMTMIFCNFSWDVEG